MTTPKNEPCGACGAEAGEDCRIGCIGKAQHDEQQPDRLSDLDSTGGTATCARCGQWKALRLYDTPRADEDGKAWLCRDCANVDKP